MNTPIRRSRPADEVGEAATFKLGEVKPCNVWVEIFCRVCAKQIFPDRASIRGVNPPEVRVHAFYSHEECTAIFYHKVRDFCEKSDIETPEQFAKLQQDIADVVKRYRKFPPAFKRLKKRATGPLARFLL